MTVSALASRGSRVVAVGSASSQDSQDAKVWWSDHGRRWDAAAVEPAVGGAMIGVTAVADGYLAVGAGYLGCLGGIWWSADGETWTCLANDATLEGFGPQAAAASSTAEVVVGLLAIECHEDDCPDDLPGGAAWWRPVVAAGGG